MGHCDDGKRFVVHAEEKLTAFVELEAAIRAVEPLAAVFCFFTTIRMAAHGDNGGSTSTSF
jgi:hypothetical protein